MLKIKPKIKKNAELDWIVATTLRQNTKNQIHPLTITCRIFMEAHLKHFQTSKMESGKIVLRL